MKVPVPIIGTALAALTITPASSTVAPSCPGCNILTEILQGGVTNKTYPGAVALVGTLNGEFHYAQAVGKFSYDEPQYQQEMQVGFPFPFIIIVT